jgi:cellulose synthase operon protein C
MTYSAELERLYSQIAELPIGPARLPLVYRALASADEADNEQAQYELRMVLAESAIRADADQEAVVAFSWILERHLADPVHFASRISAPVHVDLAWLFKWVIDALLSSSSISREQIEQTLAAMDHLYTVDGLGRSAVVTYQLSAAELMGDVHRLEELAEAVRQTPTDRHSDCRACTTHWLISADLATHGIDTALAKTDEMLKAGLTCNDEPQILLADMLLPALLAGHEEVVKQYFNRVSDNRWPAASTRLRAVAALITTAAITENVALGLELFERWLPDLATVLYDDIARLEFLAAGALLMNRAHSHELGQRPVRDSAAVLSVQSIASENEVVAELEPQLWSAAQRLADAFDANHGNSYRRDWLAEQRALSAVSQPLVLGREVADQLVIPPRERPATAADWVVRARERLWLSDIDGAILATDRALAMDALSAADRADALISRLRALAFKLQSNAAVRAIAELPESGQEQLSDLFAATLQALRDADRPGRAEAWTALGLSRLDLDWAPQEAWLVEVSHQLHAAGVSDHDLSVVTYERAMALASAGDADRSAEAALAFHEQVMSDPQPWEVAPTRLQTAFLLLAFGHPQGLSLLTQVLEDSQASPSTRAQALSLLAQHHGHAGEFDAAATRAHEAATLFLELEAPKLATDAHLVQASALEAAGDLTTSIRATRRALDLSAPLEDSDQNHISTQVELGRRLTSAGHHSEAVDALRAADTRLGATAVEDYELALECAFWLGQALRNNNALDAAANIWHAATQKAIHTGHPDHAIVLGRSLGNLYANFSMWAEAIEVFESIRPAAESSKNPIDLVGVDERVGLITCLNQDPSGLDLLNRARQRAGELQKARAVADITESTAQALWALDRTDEAISQALAASDAFATVEDLRGKYGAIGMAAEILSRAGRSNEAITLLEPVASEDEHLTAQLAALRGQSGEELT